MSPQGPTRPRRPWYQISVQAFLVLVVTVSCLIWAIRETVFKDSEVAWRAERLRSGDPEVKLEALTDLASFIATPAQAQSAWMYVARAARESAPVVRARALSLLEQLVYIAQPERDLSAEARALFGEAMRDPDPTIRASGARGLARLHAKRPSDFTRLKQLLRDNNPQVRAAAYTGLIRMSPQAYEATALSRQGMRDRDSSVRAACIKELDTLPNAASRPFLGVDTLTALVERLCDESADVRAAASRCLDGITAYVVMKPAPGSIRYPPLPTNLEPLLLRALDHDDPAVVRTAVHALRALEARSTAVVPAMLRRMLRPGHTKQISLPQGKVVSEPDVRVEVANALASIAQPEAVLPALMQAVEASEDPQIIAATASGIVRMAPPRTALPVLINLLHHNDRAVVLVAIQQLGLLGAAARPAIPALAEMLDPQDPERFAALISAFDGPLRFPDPALMEALRRLRRNTPIDDPSGFPLVVREILAILDDGPDGLASVRDLIEAARFERSETALQARWAVLNVASGNPAALAEEPEAIQLIESMSRDGSFIDPQLAQQALEQIQASTAPKQ